MSEEQRLKTLANCKNSEFMAQANKTRRLVNDYYHKLNIVELAKKYSEKYKGKERDQIREVSREFVSDVFATMLEDFPKETIQIIAVLGFMTYDEAEEIDPTDALGIVLQCISSKRVMDFFINVEVLAGSGTDSILPVLIYLKRIFGEKNTSDKESNTNTENTQNDLQQTAISQTV